MGGTVTIHGTGFSEDVFNQFDPVLGNKVDITETMDQILNRYLDL
jgi:hypothetical protein